MSNVLAIDVGTEGARAAVFSDEGEELGSGRSSYPTNHPHPGWAEQSPHHWWKAVVSSATQALQNTDARQCIGMSVATTASSVVFLDGDGSPVAPAILWMDGRAAGESADTARVEHPALRYAGGSDSSEWLVPKAMWVARNRPAEYRSAERIGEAVDYINYRLTGLWAGSRMNATCKWNYNHREDGLPHDLYATLGVPDLGEKLPQRIVPVGSPLGTLSSEAAAEIGLPEGIVVGSGGIDAHLALIPLQTQAVSPVAVAAGTSNAFVAESDEACFSPEVWGPYPGALHEDRWLFEGGQISAGSALTWVAEKILGHRRDQVEDLVRRASEIPAFSHGLLMLDHFMGNRTPLRDPQLRGALIGATIGTTGEEIYRAAVEAVGYGTRNVLESMGRAGIDTTEVFFSGGIRHNSLWMQTTADVLGRSVQEVETTNLTLVACAAIGLTAAGATQDLSRAAQRFTVASRKVEPRAEAVEALDEGFQLYREMTVATEGIAHRLSRGVKERR